MLVLLVPFNVEVEQNHARLLRERKSTENRVFRTFAQLNKVTEFDTCISRSVPRLGCFREEFLELFFSNSKRQQSACFSKEGMGFTWIGPLPTDSRAISKEVDRRVEAAEMQWH
jgi:hypothetical protein